MLARLLPSNEHTIDRVIRVILGIALLSLTFIGPKTLWGLIGLVPLLTGLIGSCPIYTLTGARTCAIKTKAT